MMMMVIKHFPMFEINGSGSRDGAVVRAHTVHQWPRFNSGQEPLISWAEFVVFLTLT